MPLFDLPLEQLQTYQPARFEPADFDAFWQNTLGEARQHPLNPRFEPVDYGLKTLEVLDVTFAGYGGQPIKGWLLLPKLREGRLPCVVEYVGYGGGRGFPVEWLTYASAGYAHLVMDTRGQGSRWRRGDTPDLAPDGDNPQHPGFMTRGVLSPRTYYYRRLFTDAVRAVETARSHPAVDPGRIAVAGGSQGGGIALAVAGLSSEGPSAPDARPVKPHQRPGDASFAGNLGDASAPLGKEASFAAQRGAGRYSEVQAVMPDVPFLCHFRRATELVDTAPYNEIATFCKIHRDRVEQVFTTLSYFDGVNFAARAKAKALFSVGLMDDICPPSTVYAAHNHYAGPKEIKVYPYNNHEGGESFHTLEKLRFLRGLGW